LIYLSQNKHLFQAVTTYLLPRFMASDVPIIDMANNMLLQILAAWKYQILAVNI
jgi:hypothetical protein